MSRRSGVAGAILLAWVAGLGLLAHRELFRGAPERLARAALLVAPSAEYYTVSRGGRQIGFASSTVDTTRHGVEVTDYLVADIPANGPMRRTSFRAVARLSRSLRLRDFVLEVGPAVGRVLVTGVTAGDSLLTVVVTAGREPADTQRVRLARPLLVPSVVPMVLALAESPDVGERYTFSVFDPATLRPEEMTVRLAAESLFVVADSAALDPGSDRFVPVRRDTVHAWRVEQDGGGPLTGWVDEKGRAVETTQFGGLELRRTAFEIAYENWARDSRRRPGVAGATGVPHTDGAHSERPEGHRVLRVTP